jgi:hypothetical protein
MGRIHSLVGGQLCKLMEVLALVHFQGAVERRGQAAQLTDTDQWGLRVIPDISWVDGVAMVELHVEKVSLDRADGHSILQLLPHAFRVQARIEDRIERTEIHSLCLVFSDADSSENSVDLSEAQMGDVLAPEGLDDLASSSSSHVNGDVGQFASRALGTRILENSLDSARQRLVG